ncbi:hypothetical protein N0B51_06465 [Tsuneonella sp. YG55]|uniref:Uncharacterized protein n=1 Tax=Tsuneonella litorea TaxID=2976475 RepID=A0A9X3AKN6_9SPHN|nr:hypothetical protein [Tsuneonella litorea]MCT2558619.1 hypothetical protein [Tsuneonella litorea]
MLTVIDGTGDANGLTYRRNMTGGMCDRLAKAYKGRYYRGPVLDGHDTFDIAESAYRDIRADAALGRQPLFLAGHSRGGAAVIRVAQWLKRDGVSVEAMFLYDAVDRTFNPFVDVQIVPSNVKRVYHARRSGEIVDYFSKAAEDTAKELRVFLLKKGHKSREVEDKRKLAQKYGRLDDAMKLRMRSSNGFFESPSIDFGNCGVGLEDNPKGYKEEFFLGSHGAIGGSFIGAQDGAWQNPADALLFQQIANADKAAVSSVSAWMAKAFDETALKLHGGVRTEAR